MELSLQDFLLWVGSTAGSGVVASFILERIQWFQSLAADAKKWVSVGTMSLLGVASFLTLNYVPAETLALIAPYFLIIASAFGSVFSGELFHKADKKDGVG